MITYNEVKLLPSEMSARYLTYGCILEFLFNFASICKRLKKASTASHVNTMNCFVLKCVV